MQQQLFAYFEVTGSGDLVPMGSVEYPEREPGPAKIDEILAKGWIPCGSTMTGSAEKALLLLIYRRPASPPPWSRR